MVLDKWSRLTAAAAALSVALTGCASHSSNSTGPAPPAKLVVACTISTLCSLVEDVGGGLADVRGIVPIGASPETYEPTPSDIIAVSQASVLVENGNGLEVWLQKLLTSAAASDLRIVVLSDGVPASERVIGNPHLWLDPTYAGIYVREIADTLSAADPAHAPAYHANASREERRLAVLDTWIRAQIDRIPKERRAMICFHDAWLYFDRRYGITDVGAIEQSPGQEPSAGYFAKLTAQAKAYHVNAIFGEPQFSPKLANALAASSGITVVSELYDDTLGTAPGMTDYEGMLRYDVTTIVTALSR